MSAADSHIASSSAGLVDHSKVIELEHIDCEHLPKKTPYHLVKRIFDVVSCSAALVVLAIPMGAIAIAIKRDSPGPVFFKQERLGLNGKPFEMIKFRSMRADAEKAGAQWATEDDPRVTKLGHFLRKTRLDEIPQFWNVVKGEMSLIGPRPERAVFYDEFEQYIHGFNQRLAVKPGITGLAQVNGGYNLLPEEKIVFDLEYVKRQSLKMDLGIIAKTLGVLVTHEGAL